MEDAFGYVKEAFPMLRFIPDSSSKHLERPDYYQIFYDINYLGIIWNKELLSEDEVRIELINDLEKITGLPQEKCSKLADLIRSLDY